MTDKSDSAIVHHEGTRYDPTALEKPLCFLPKPVIDALYSCPHGWLVLTVGGEWIDKRGPATWDKGSIIRAKPAPTEKTVVLYGRLSEGWGWIFGDRDGLDTHTLTFTTRDGEPVGSGTIERI